MHKILKMLNLTTAIKSIVTPIQDYLKTKYVKKENFVGNERRGNYDEVVTRFNAFKKNSPFMTLMMWRELQSKTIKETNIHDTREGHLSGL